MPGPDTGFFFQSWVTGSVLSKSPPLTPESPPRKSYSANKGPNLGIPPPLPSTLLRRRGDFFWPKNNSPKCLEKTYNCFQSGRVLFIHLKGVYSSDAGVFFPHDGSPDWHVSWVGNLAAQVKHTHCTPMKEIKQGGKSPISLRSYVFW